MQTIAVKKGLNLPIQGEPEQVIYDETDKISSVALIGPDYPGMRPTMAVREGDMVRAGQVLFTDKKTEGVQMTAPAAGRVAAVHRGEKRVFQSIVIERSGKDAQQFTSYSDSKLGVLKREQVVENLVSSGLWTALRTRPYSKVPTTGSEPQHIFVTAIDTNPLAASVDIILKEYEQDFLRGLHVLQHLTEGKIYCCFGKSVSVDLKAVEKATPVAFAGPHPAGLPGTHMHFLAPVSRERINWYINYQDVIAVGKLFVTGELWLDRIVSLAGPTVQKPRLVKTCLGANLEQLAQGSLQEGDNRLISGSVLSGRNASGPFSFLGRYHLQVSVIEEDRKRVFLGWQGPGFDKWSIKNVFASAMYRQKKHAFTSSTHGSKRAMVPIGMYEQVMPLDIIPTFLLRAITVNDLEQAEQLGCLELDEEDLALCTFVCPGKTEYGPLLRHNLEQIEKGL